MSAPRRWDVLGVGDADVDLYLRVSRLAGRDEKVLGGLLGELPGGVVANFACAASRMGMRTALATIVGDDRYGEIALDGLREASVATDLVLVKPGGRTYFCVVMLDDTGEKALTVVETDCMSPDITDLDPESFGEARLVHLMASDFDVTVWIAREARRRGTLVSLDIEPTTVSDDFASLLGLVDLAFPNREGLRRLAAGDELAGARQVLALGPRVVVVTMGSQGCLIVSAEETIRLPAFPVPVVDTTGAGDCFNGAFVSGYLRGWDLARCGRTAAAAAALSVTAVGSRTAQPTLTEVERFLTERVT
ncbi:MAG: carbohydrate kinase family protein [Thermomicrobiales bacterium]